MAHVADVLTVYATGQFEAWHSWKDAPEEVSYLRVQHRHIFHWKVKIQVTHEDRDVEFITLKKYIQESIPNYSKEDNAGSCEQLCTNLKRTLANKYARKRFKISVSEDKENGATLQGVL